MSAMPDRQETGLDKQKALIASMVGLSITAATWEDGSGGYEWTGHETMTITLEDGRVFKFSGWGYDAWGMDVDLVLPPKEEESV